MAHLGHKMIQVVQFTSYYKNIFKEKDEETVSAVRCRLSFSLPLHLLAY